MKPVIIDLYCKQGGATRGYQNAGFYVIGVDKDPQPRYVGDEFIQGDVLEIFYDLPVANAYHASPPCQEFTRAQQIQGNNHVDLIEPTRDLLIATSKPYVIENVPGAPLIDPTVLYGTAFGLRVNRPRLFECNFPVPFLLMPAPIGQAKMGRPPRFEGDFIQPVGNFSAVGYARDAMGIDWMSRDGLREAIPPAYTEFIGCYLMKAIQEMAK